LDSIWNPILDTLGLNTNPQATIKANKFGNFTANFETAPAPIPPEYVATLFGIIATAFVSSWLTPAIIRRRKQKKQRGRLIHYRKEVQTLYEDGKLDLNDIKKLSTLREKIADEYSIGKLNKE